MRPLKMTEYEKIVSYWQYISNRVELVGGANAGNWTKHSLILSWSQFAMVLPVTRISRLYETHKFH